MTNTNSHQNPALSRISQPHTTIEQILPTKSLVQSVARTNGKHSAWSTRISPLDAAGAVSRSSARQPADRTGEWPPRPTHNRLSQSNKNPDPHQRQAVTLMQLNSNSHNEHRPDIPHPGTGSKTYTSGPTSGRGEEPINPNSSQKAFTHAKRPPRGVRQDKDRNKCDRAASLRPAAVNKFTRSQAMSRKSARSKNDSADNPRCVPVQVWVAPVVKAELSRIASQDGLSLSSAGAAFLTRGIQQNVDMQYGALLKPVIEDAIAKQMRGIATRLSWLLVRVAFDWGQTRSLVTNILGRQPGVTQPVLNTILDGSDKSARANIMRRTPQITQLIKSVEQWMTDQKDEKSV